MTTPDPDRDGLEGDTPVPGEEPRAPLDVDTTFAAIVARWADEDDDTVTPSWPDSENVEPPWERRHTDAPADPSAESPAAPAAPATPVPGSGEPPAVVSEPRVIRPATPDPFDVPLSATEASLDERFVPPEPPPLPRGDLFSRLAWGCVLGGPIFLLLAAMLWREAPQGLVLAAVGAFIGGFVALVVRLPQNHDDDEDDGAVV